MSRLVLALGVCAAAVVFVAIFFAEKENLSRRFETNVGGWAPAMASAFIAKDHGFAVSAAGALHLPAAAWTTVKTEDGMSITHPAEGLDGSCVGLTSVPIVRYGVRVGTVSTCFKPGAIVRAVFVSPPFILSVVAFIIVGALGQLIALARYRRTLLDSLTAVERWTEGPQADLVLPDEGRVKRDPVGARLVALIRTGAEMRVKLQKSCDEAESARQLKEVYQQVAHDIRAPLAALKVGLGDLAGVDGDTETLFRTAVGRIDEIADDLRVRPDANAPTIASKGESRVVLAEAIESVLAEKRIQHGGHRFEFNCAGGDRAASGFIAGHKIRRVISNLVENAVDASAQDSRVSVTLKSSGLVNIISIEDCGIGIPADVVSRLFERGMTYDKDGGTGLGLWHARETVETAGGTIELRSQPGLGTTVAFALPAYAEA